MEIEGKDGTYEDSGYQADADKGEGAIYIGLLVTLYQVNGS